MSNLSISSLYECSGDPQNDGLHYTTIIYYTVESIITTPVVLTYYTRDLMQL